MNKLASVLWVLLVLTAPALAGDTQRDHRGPNGAPEGGVTVNGSEAKVGKPPFHFGCEKCKSSTGFGGTGTPGKSSGNNGATIRDHR